jgi:hypothetical protein
MTTITILCRVTWWEQCQWIYKNCTDAVDRTDWGLWQLGQSDIHFDLDEKDAVWFNLMWV